MAINLHREDELLSGIIECGEMLFLYFSILFMGVGDDKKEYDETLIRVFVTEKKKKKSTERVVMF